MKPRRITREMLLDAQGRRLTIAELARDKGFSQPGVRDACRALGVALPKDERRPGRPSRNPDDEDVDDSIAHLAHSLDNRGIVAFARALDAGQTLVGARFDALLAMRASHPIAAPADRRIRRTPWT
jgi:hypothetical protein